MSRTNTVAAAIVALAVGVPVVYGQTTTIHADPGSLGAISDSPMCGTPGAPRDVTFVVSGLAPVATVVVTLDASHPAVGEVVATLIAPGGAQHVVFARTRATSDNLYQFIEWVGDDSRLAGVYTFSDTSPGDWWAAAHAAGSADAVAPGSYRTSQSGGAGSTGQATLMNAAFSGVGANGTWRLRFTDLCAFHAGAVNAASITIGTTPVTIASAADAYAVTSPTMLHVPAPGVLANDTTTAGSLAATLLSGPTHGVLTFNADGSFQYSPLIGYSGPDTFLYRASAAGAIGPDTPVTLTVVSPAPQGVADAYMVDMDSPLTVAAPGVLGNDVAISSPLTAQLVSAPQHGMLTLAPNGAFSYLPAPGYSGNDSFVYRPVLAGSMGTDAAVTIAVNATLQPPTALAVAWIKRLTLQTEPHEVVLRWQAPAVGPRPTSYRVVGGTTPGAATESLVVDARYPITALRLRPGRYYVRVFSHIDEHASSASQEFSFGVGTTGRDAPAPPTMLRTAVEGANVTLTWKASYAAATPVAWELFYQPLSGELGGHFTFDSPGEFLKADGVPAGIYTLELRAWSDVADAIPTSITLTVPGSCTAVPDPPTQMLAFELGNEVGVIWDPPAGGAPHTHYYLQVSGGANINVPTAGRLIRVPKVRGTFDVRVVAANACGESAPTPMQTLSVQ